MFKYTSLKKKYVKINWHGSPNIQLCIGGKVYFPKVNGIQTFSCQVLGGYLFNTRFINTKSFVYPTDVLILSIIELIWLNSNRSSWRLKTNSWLTAKGILSRLSRFHSFFIYCNRLINIFLSFINKSLHLWRNIRISFCYQIIPDYFFKVKRWFH